MADRGGGGGGGASGGRGGGGQRGAYRGRGGGGRGRGGGAGGGGGGEGGGSGRGDHRGSGGDHRGGHHHRGGGRGGGGGGGHHHHSGSNAGNAQDRERPKKENILDLAKYMDKEILVKFNGGREATGTLKGYDALMNLVLDEVKEMMRDEEGNESSRPLGLVVVRGTLLVSISPVDGSEQIANPFVEQEDDD